MASPGKDYPNKAHDLRRRPRFSGEADPVERQVREQAPTLSPEQVARLEELDALDAIMRDTGGHSAMSQVTDYLIREGRQY